MNNNVYFEPIKTFPYKEIVVDLPKPVWRISVDVGFETFIEFVIMELKRLDEISQAYFPLRFQTERMLALIKEVVYLTSKVGETYLGFDKYKDCGDPVAERQYALAKDTTLNPEYWQKIHDVLAKKFLKDENKE